MRNQSLAFAPCTRLNVAAGRVPLTCFCMLPACMLPLEYVAQLCSTCVLVVHPLAPTCALGICLSYSQ